MRVRKAGDEHWILGVILPFPGVEVTGVEPGAEYEIQTTILSRDKKPLGGPMVQGRPWNWPHHAVLDFNALPSKAARRKAARFLTEAAMRRPLPI